MPRFNLLSKPQPFIGILLVCAGWAVSHQWGSNTVFDDCRRAGGVTVVLVSLFGLLVVAAGGLYALHGWRLSEGSGRKFLGALGALMAPIAAFAVLLQLAAGLILPPCAG